MTQEAKALAEAKALEIIRKADLEPADQYPLLADITTALLAARREGLEEAAKDIDKIAAKYSKHGLRHEVANECAAAIRHLAKERT